MINILNSGWEVAINTTWPNEGQAISHPKYITIVVPKVPPKGALDVELLYETCV